MIGLPGEYKLWNFGDEQQSFVHVKSSLTVSVTKSSLGAAGNRTWVTEDNFVRRTLFTMLMFNSNPAFEESMIEIVSVSWTFYLLEPILWFRVMTDSQNHTIKNGCNLVAGFIPCFGPWNLDSKFWVSTPQMCAEIANKVINRTPTKEILPKNYKATDNGNSDQPPIKRIPSFPFFFLAFSHLVTPRNVAITTHLK